MWITLYKKQKNFLKQEIRLHVYVVYHTKTAVKEVPKVQKTELQVNTIGKPNIQSLLEAEQRSFYETLLAHIQQLKTQDGK